MITFIVIGKNEDWRLGKCLSAILRRAETELAQSWEVIYVDSQSTDGSVELARQYADKVFLITGECNPAIGRNIGAKEATGDILFFLDGDMELREGVLTSILYKGKLKYPIMEGVDYNILYDNEWHLKDESPRTAYVDGMEWFENSPSGGMFVIEHRLWEVVGGMDNRFVVSEDLDFGFRLCAKGYPVLRVGQLWVNHYTRYYAVRSGYLKFRKYEALLARRHLLNSYAHKPLLRRFYSEVVLFCSVLLLLVFRSPYVMVPYCLVLLMRSIRVIQKTSVRLNWAKVLLLRFLKDCLFIVAFIFFYPSKPELRYKSIKS